VSAGSEHWLIEILDGGGYWVEFLILLLVGRHQSLDVGGRGAADVVESEESCHEVQVNEGENSFELPVSSLVQDVLLLSSSHQSGDLSDWEWVFRKGFLVDGQSSVKISESFRRILILLQNRNWLRAHFDIAFVLKRHPTQVNED